MKLQITCLLLILLVVKLSAEGSEEEFAREVLDSDEESNGDNNSVVKNCYKKAENDFEKCVIWRHSTKLCQIDKAKYLSTCLPPKPEKKPELSEKQRKDMIKHCNSQAEANFNQCVIWNLSTKVCERQKATYLHTCLPKEEEKSHHQEQGSEETAEIERKVRLRSQNNATQSPTKFIRIDANQTTENPNNKSQKNHNTTHPELKVENSQLIINQTIQNLTLQSHNTSDSDTKSKRYQITSSLDLYTSDHPQTQKIETKNQSESKIDTILNQNQSQTGTFYQTSSKPESDTESRSKEPKNITNDRFAFLDTTVTDDSLEYDIL